MKKKLSRVCEKLNYKGLNIFIILFFVVLQSSFINAQCDLSGGTLEGGPFAFCVGDGEVDNIPEGDITVSGASGTNAQWVITDDQGTILGLPPTFSVVDFDGAGEGTCLVWYLSYEDGLMGLEPGNNAGTDLEGCYDLSNPIEVNRSQPEGGTLEGGPFEFCVDGESDFVSGIVLSGNSGSNSQWLITNEQGTILGLPPMPGVVDFDGAGAGVCLIYHLSYEDGLTGLSANSNLDDLEGCFALTNYISVTRNGTDEDGDGVTVCAGDTFDNDPTIYPGAPELCDGLDNDLDGSIDEPENLNTSNEWIDNVTIANIDNTSGDDEGYGNYCEQSTDLAIGQDYEIHLTPGYLGKDKPKKWRVYIDLNQDGIFSHPSERVAQKTGKGTQTADINIGSDAFEGETKMRVIMSRNGHKEACDDNYAGEVEDYTINVVGSGNYAIDSGSPLESLFADSNVKGELNISTYPNPVRDLLNLKITGANQNYTLQMVNSVGTLVWSTQEKAERQTLSLDITRLGLNDGSYTLLINTGNTILTKNIIVIR